MKCAVALLSLFTSSLLAQNPPVNATQLRGRNISTTAPTNGQVYVWNALTGFWTPGASSGGGVTSVTGTANQICVATGTTTPALSICTALDLSGLTSTKPIKSGTSLPATCGVGEFYDKTDATAGSNLYSCTATNTWTVVGGGASPAGSADQMQYNAGAGAFGAYLSTTHNAAVTDGYGLLIPDQTGATNNWALKTGLGLVDHLDKTNIGDRSAGGGGWDYGNQFSVLRAATQAENATIANISSFVNLSGPPAFTPTAIEFDYDLRGTGTAQGPGALAVYLTLKETASTSVGGSNFPPNAIYGNASINGDGGQTADFLAGVYGHAATFSGTLGFGVGVWGDFLQGGGTMTAGAAFYAPDLASGITGVSNAYYSWFDSRGVGRCKEDAAFNGTGQVICAAYNNAFTKYTPGAVNYERGVYGEWDASNVYHVTTEAGGTGVLRNIQIDGAEVDLGTASHLVNIEAATFKWNGKTCTLVGTTPSCS